MPKLNIRDINLEGKRVFVRVDFNVPLKGGEITDDTRIRAAIPTIEYILSQQASVVLASHLGRPKGKAVQEFRLDPVAKRLSELLGQEVVKVDDIVGERVRSAVSQLRPGQCLLLENLRFDPREKGNDDAFANMLAELADVYVNDAFGVSHRKHASVTGITKHLHPAVAGFLLEKEINYAAKIIESPVRPFTAIVGGAKVSDKIGVIESLIKKVDHLIIGGGMANTFLKAQGCNVGKSLVEEEKVSYAHELMLRAAELSVKIHLPVDVVVAEEFSADVQSRTVSVDDINDNDMALDIGPQTAKMFADVVISSGLVVWNGPMGVFEISQFAEGTKAVASAMAQSEAETVVGGGDSAAAVNSMGYASQVNHISTGGGAFLAMLEGKALPGVVSLSDK